MDFITALFGRFHPLLVHLPIGILFIAFLFEWLSATKKFKPLRKAVQPALFWGGLFAIAAAISGYFLRQEGGYEAGIADLHQNLGIATAVLCIIVYALRRRTKFWIADPVRRKRLRIILFIPLILLLSLTGHWGGSLTHLPTGDSLALSEIGAVWMRKKGRFSYRSKDLAPQERAHADAETRHLLLGLLYSLDCYWMSHPLALRAASWKGEQLKRAAGLGFATPASIVTNCPTRVADFIEAQGEIVFKPASSPSLAAEQVASGERLAVSLPTTMITPDHAGDLDAVAEAPCLFQRYIPKRHELRVTVIGGEVFSARIHSLSLS